MKSFTSDSTYFVVFNFDNVFCVFVVNVFIFCVFFFIVCSVFGSFFVVFFVNVFILFVAFFVVVVVASTFAFSFRSDCMSGVIVFIVVSSVVLVVVNVNDVMLCLVMVMSGGFGVVCDDVVDVCVVDCDGGV